MNEGPSGACCNLHSARHDFILGRVLPCRAVPNLAWPAVEIAKGRQNPPKRILPPTGKQVPTYSKSDTSM